MVTRLDQTMSELGQLCGSNLMPDAMRLASFQCCVLFQVYSYPLTLDLCTLSMDLQHNDVESAGPIYA